MIRRVFSIDRNTMMDCFYIVNQFMDAHNAISWECLQRRVQFEQAIMFVAEKENGYLKGFLVGSVKQNVALIDNLFIDRQFQRSGVGTALMIAYENFVRRYGAKQIVLQSRPTKQAVDFYQKNGFVKINLEYYMQKSL